MLDELNNKRLTEAGSLDMLEGSDSDGERDREGALPGEGRECEKALVKPILFVGKASIKPFFWVNKISSRRFWDQKSYLVSRLNVLSSVRKSTNLTAFFRMTLSLFKAVFRLERHEPIYRSPLIPS